MSKRFVGKKRIYLDYASATPVAGEALRAMSHAQSAYGNPGSIHADGVAAKKILEESRAHIAHELGVKAREIIFTSGATEGNNLAILGLARGIFRKIGAMVPIAPQASLLGTHWTVSSIEHDSVLECFAEVERLGGTVTFLDPDSRGIVSAEKVARALRPETVLVSVGWGNNEIGVVQPLREIARVIRGHNDKKAPPAGQAPRDARVLFHSDMGQAPLYLVPHMHTLGLHMAVFGSGKLYGPRGIGALCIANHVDLEPLSFGGSQERGLRAGTESPALTAGFAEALYVIGRERHAEAKRLGELRNELACELVTRIPGIVINSDLKHTLPHMLNISIPDINAEYVILTLDRAGISISTKSACREGETISHVVAALGGEEWRARNTLRFSLGRGTKPENIARTVKELTDALSKARA